MDAPDRSLSSDLSRVSLHQPPSEQENQVLKTDLLPALWNLSPETHAEPSAAFLEYYMNQRIAIEVHKLNLQTHGDLIDLTNFVKDRAAALTKTGLISHFDRHYAWGGRALYAIEVAIRIWLPISIDEWDATQTLEEYVHSTFLKTEDLPAASSFPLSFNILSLKEIGGFEVVWTECLQDHLSLSVEDTQKELKIFHLSSFLQGYRHSSDCQILPPGLLDETTRTLSLLLPSTNLQCQRWVRKARKQEDIDLEAGLLPPTSRDISTYPYWGRRLLELRDEYDRTEPTTVKQWILDKRKPNQRYTFWIAVIALFLALVFGLIQSVTGILQVIKS